MQQKRILLMHITDISGHKSAALAIEKAIKTLDSSPVVRIINAFHHTNPISERIVNSIYMGIIRKTPHIWKYLYDNPKVKEDIGILENTVYYFNCRKLKPLFDEFKPDVVAATQAFPCGMVAAFKRRYRANIPLVGILTDHAPHSYWIHPEVDDYVVASQEVKSQLSKKGVPEEKIKIYGIPIDPKFKKTSNKNLVAQKIDLDLNLPIILVMGGGQGLGPIENIILTLDNMDLYFQIIVVSGTNQGLYSWLLEKKGTFKKKITSFSYIENIDEIMDISTLIITKAGGLTISEALTKGLPIIVVDPIPGQETFNTDFLLDHDAAVKIKDQYELDIVVREFLTNPERLNLIRENARKISKPDSATDIARLLLSK